MKKISLSYVSFCKISFSFFIGVLVVACTSKSTQETQSADSVVNTPQAIVANTTPVAEQLYLEDVLACENFEGLIKKYGAENLKKEVTIETGEGQFKVTKLFPDTEKEVEIYWKDGKAYQQIQDALVRVHETADKKMSFNSPWNAKEAGVRLGMPLSEVVQLNGKTFTISGFGWDLGGSVVSWEGGKLASKNLMVGFNDYSGNNGGLSSEAFAAISGEMEFDVVHPSIKQLNPIVDKLSVFKKPEITKDLGQKMVKEVEAKQVKK